ncbi:MAG: hypothetical protein JXA20_05780 [Spirochaetes bacterium]|nr:hypothetical protein [Spirochaetota bacterium]
MKKLPAAIAALCIIPGLLWGAEDRKAEEDELFANPETVIDSKTIEKEDLDADQNRKRLGISGKITSVNTYIAERVDGGGDRFTPYILGALFLDARLPQNVKGFANLEAQYDASENRAEFNARELFIDFNIAKTVYFRTGKQIIQWGRCYLWNPTDLLNVEKKTFLTKIASREGTYGLKMHVPFGTAANLYGFAATHTIDDAAEISGAGKIEFLIGRTEMAFSAWGKRHRHPVFGYDFSTRLLEIDIVGEVSVSRGSNTRKVRAVGNILTADRNDTQWIARACVDLGHAFDFNGQPDRIQVNLEFFFNGDGYHRNVFRDNAIYQFDLPVAVEYAGYSVPVAAGTRALYLSANDLFEVNYHSRYYAALFMSLSRFINSDFTLKGNVLGNIAQHCYIASVGLAYANINDFRAGIEVYGFFGKRKSEYNYAGNAALVLLTAGIVF